jgi:uncharacterized C2H2 Zn-finger protein
MTSPTYAKPIRQTVFVADLKCYLCGSVFGSIESEQPLTATASARPVLLRQRGLDQPLEVLAWQRLRCDRCGGPLFLDETDVITRRIDEYNWLDERPRRGRPPKRLVEQRRRERELFEAQAAA